MGRYRQILHADFDGGKRGSAIVRSDYWVKKYAHNPSSIFDRRGGD
jgi:hypothetical protein